MKIIARCRGTGKTTDLIKESALTGSYILVSNKSMVRSIMQSAQQMGLKIPYPVTIDELKMGNFQKSSIKRDGLLVDNAELVLQQLIGTKINTLTISVDEEE